MFRSTPAGRTLTPFAFLTSRKTKSFSLNKNSLACLLCLEIYNQNSANPIGAEPLRTYYTGLNNPRLLQFRGLRSTRVRQSN